MNKEQLSNLKHDLEDLQELEFKNFLAKHGIAEEKLLDDCIYYGNSATVGCFVYSSYYVYNILEDGKFFDIHQHSKKIDAFKDIADRFGLRYDEVNGLKR